LFTKTWGEGFVEKPVSPSPLLPEITLQDLAPYLRKTSKRYRKMMKRKSAGMNLASSRPPESTAVPESGTGSRHGSVAGQATQIDQLVQLFPKLSALRAKHQGMGRVLNLHSLF
jgi:hypothetical protein